MELQFLWDLKRKWNPFSLMRWRESMRAWCADALTNIYSEVFVNVARNCISYTGDQFMATVEYVTIQI